MAWNDLKASIASVIKTNGNKEITGNILQQTLNSIVDQVGLYATFKGVAEPDTTPGVPDGVVFYMAVQSGVYANFGVTVPTNDLYVLKFNGTGWDLLNLGNNKDVVSYTEPQNRTEQEKLIARTNTGAVGENIDPESNLLNPYTVKEGWIDNTGAIHTQVGYYHSDFIPIEEGQTLFASFSAGDNPQITLWDENHIFIPGTSVNSSTKQITGISISKYAVFSIVGTPSNLMISTLENPPFSKYTPISGYIDKTIYDDISLRSEFTTLKNMEKIPGTYSEGIFEDASQVNYETSSFIEVPSIDNNDSLYFLWGSTMVDFYSLVRFYDKNQAEIARVQGNSESRPMIAGVPYKFIPDKKVKYIRYANLKSSNLANGGFLKGSGVSLDACILEVINDNNIIDYGYSLFTELKKGDGSYDADFRSVVKRKKTCSSLIIKTAGYPVHKVFMAFDKDGVEITNKTIYGSYVSAPTNVDLSDPNIDSYSVSVVPVVNGGDITPLYVKEVSTINQKELKDLSLLTYKKTVNQNKKVLILGTSIDEWGTHFDNCFTDLGWTYYKKALGSSGICLNSGVLGNDRDGKDLSESAAEKVIRYSGHIGDGTGGTVTQQRYDEMMDWGYDKMIIPYINGVSGNANVVIFSHGYNDRAAIYDELPGINSIDWNPSSTANRATFSGAFRFLCAKIWEINPKIKIVVSGFLEAKSDLTQRAGGGIYTMHKAMSEALGLTFLDIANHAGFSLKYAPNTNNYLSDLNTQYGTSFTKAWQDGFGNITFYQMYCPDSVHPFTDPTRESGKILNRVYMNEIRSKI